LLSVLRRCLRKREVTARTNNAMPRQIQRFRRHPQRKPCLACTARQSRGTRHSSVGRDSPPRNRTHHLPDRIQRRVVVRRPGLARTRALWAQRPKQRRECSL